LYSVGGRTSARRKPYRNDTRKPSNRTTSRTRIDISKNETKKPKHARVDQGIEAEL
jgi:hypothetical protein